MYLASVRTRTRKGHVCPYCSNKKVSVTNSLARVFPELAREWHPVLNEGLGPEDVTCARRMHPSYCLLGSHPPHVLGYFLSMLTCVCLPIRGRHRDYRGVVASRGSVCGYDGVEGVDCEAHALSAVHGLVASARPLFRPSSSTDAGACSMSATSYPLVQAYTLAVTWDRHQNTLFSSLSSLSARSPIDVCCSTRLGAVGNRRKRWRTRESADGSLAAPGAK